MTLCLQCQSKTLNKADRLRIICFTGQIVICGRKYRRFEERFGKVHEKVTKAGWSVRVSHTGIYGDRIVQVSE